MMKILSIILLAIISLFLPAVVFGAEENLTLEQARVLALSNSRELTRYSTALRSSQLDEKTQAYTFLPSLSLEGSAGTTLWNDEGASPQLWGDSLSAGVNLKVTETLPLWDGGKYSIQKILNGLTTESAKQDALAGYYAVLDSSDAAFYAVLAAAANLQAAESSLETANLSLSMAEIRIQNKMIGEADYLQALADQESRKNTRDQARRDLSLSKLKLKNILGLENALPELENIDFADYEALFQTLAGMDDDGVDSLYTALFAEIAKRNPTLVKAGISSARAEQNVSLTALAYSPMLSLSLSTGLSYAYSNGGTNGTAGNSGLGPFTGNLTISGKIPLDFWVTASNVEKQKLAQEQTALTYLNAEDSLEMELQTDILSLISQAGQVLSSRRALEYAEKHFDYILELFSLAQRSTSDLSSADSLVLSNRNQLIRAQYGLLSALSKIRSLGVFETEDSVVALVMNTAAR